MNQKRNRNFERLGTALLQGGALVVGVALGTFSLVRPMAPAEAGEHNYVRSTTHDGIAGVRLDEEITVRFAADVLRRTVGPDTILIRSGTNNSEQARGQYLTGKFMYDRSTQRRVVIRPEAIQEYYQLKLGLSRIDAQRKARRFIENMEATGRFRSLAKIDRDLAQIFGPSYGAGTRIDDETVTGIYPPQLLPGDDLSPYRLRIAGDDALWQDYLVNGSLEAFPALEGNAEYERFYHPRDPATGVPQSRSVLRERQYRKVMIDRRNERRAMFVPDIPIRADLTDSGFVAGRAYSIVIPSAQPGVFNTVLTKKGLRPLLQEGQQDYSTLFTTVAGSNTSAVLYLGGEARTGVNALQKPRIINQTPPNAEAFVDSSTDWEDPDNAVFVPLTARKTFVIRLRFAQPLDPRTVNTSTFQVVKTKTSPGTPTERSVNIPVPVGVFLSQNRLGLVEVEVTPATNLDPASQYDVVVLGSVRTLGALANGTPANLAQDYRTSFIVGPGPVPLDRIRESFTQTTNRASPLDPFTLGLNTTAMWPAPALFDPEGSGKLVASFMPFVGFGQGAPADPQNPIPFDPNDPNSFPVTDLALTSGQSITFVTEGLDPGDPATFGRQIEYEYHSVSFASATANVVGRFPLVLRSQTVIDLDTSSIFANGRRGVNGTSNTDLVTGPPTGGLGGAGGSGGFRGGDGAMAPLTDANGDVILDSFGNRQFDPNKFDGSDGAPGFIVSGPNTGGAGSGGFSGDQEGPTVNGPDGLPAPDTSPARIREAGGGGGHATAGGNGTSSGGTQQTHPGGYFGGRGGVAYGAADMSDQPVNAKGAPTLGAGSGGAGGGGGGGEDDANASSVAGTPGPEDAGGGGGGGGGGGIHLVARTRVRLVSSILDVSGGVGGRTFDAAQADVGEGAPGGCGAGGTIWIQSPGDIQILNGSTVTAAGGTGSLSNNIGQIHPDPPDVGVVTGLGGVGGLGYVRFEAGSSWDPVTQKAATPVGSNVIGVESHAQFTPSATGSYPSHPGVPMVMNLSTAYSRWFNSQLDTPSFVPEFDDPSTPAIEGTSLFVPSIPATGVFSADVLVRTAPADVNDPANPDATLITEWTPLADVGTISDRRFLQFRVDFVIPLAYTFDQPRPYVDVVSIAIELQ